MPLHLIDWLVIALYAAFAIAVGVRFARRAGRDVDEYFLSGRRLPWWLAGTSMVATTFAADTPLVIGGWVRDHGIWKNWLWWCYAAGGTMTAFLFARYWRRGRVMTTAELAERRYGGRGAHVLRGFLGFYHAGIGNTIVLCWVMLAAAKIMDVLLGVDQTWGLVVACTVAMSYSLLAGFWGVVLTDLVQFVMAMIGSVTLAVVCWNAIGGIDSWQASMVASGRDVGDTLSFFPSAGEGAPWRASFWTTSLAAIAVYLGIAWWAVDSVDGGGLVVQRVAATRDERHGALAVLLYNVTHNALRPWPWILVALASLVILPPIEVTTPVAGAVREQSREAVVVEPEGGGAPVRLELEPGDDVRWRPVPVVEPGTSLAAGAVVARTDSERAYVVMMARYLPVGLLGLAVAALLAAFMSTVDTHVNLASSYFVNDVYRRFLVKGGTPRHYVAAARLASLGVMLLAALLAARSRSISKLFLFFLSFLGGVGPVYVMRWLWWRVTAATEITAMVASSAATVVLSFAAIDWPSGPLTPGGELAPEGRLVGVAVFSLVCSLASLWLTPRPDPARLVEFYSRVRPLGLWGPVRALAAVDGPADRASVVVVGIAGGLMLTLGMTAAIGCFFLGRGGAAWVLAATAAAGAAGVAWSLSRDTSLPRGGSG